MNDDEKPDSQQQQDNQQRQDQQDTVHPSRNDDTQPITFRKNTEPKDIK